MSEKSFSWGELADFTHAKQVEEFGFCGCEDNEGRPNPFDDCPSNRVVCPNGEGDPFACEPFCVLCEGSGEVVA